MYTVKALGLIEGKPPFQDEGVGVWMIPMKVQYEDGVEAEANVPFLYEGDYDLVKERLEADEVLYFNVPSA